MENEKSNCFVFGNSILKSVSKSVIWRSKLACDWNCEIFGDLDERLVARAGFVVGMVTFCVAILKKKNKKWGYKIVYFWRGIAREKLREFSESIFSRRIF